MEDIEKYAQYSPFMAALTGRDEAAKIDLYRRFSLLPEEVAETLTNPDTADQIEAWEQQGVFPPTYSSAVAKIIALAVLGIIQPNQIQSLLEKLNLDSATAMRTSDVVVSIVGPALSFIDGYRHSVDTTIAPTPLNPERTPVSLPQTLKTLPPLTQRIPAVAQTPDSSKTPARNIIDLRKQQPEQ